MSTSGSFLLLAVSPPGRSEISVIDRCAGLAEPLLDLRYGTVEEQRRLAEEALGRRLDGLTVFLEARQEPLVSFLTGSLPPGGRIILSDTDGCDASIGQFLQRARGRDIAVGFEVGSWGEATRAAAAGAGFLVVSGVEAGGPVSAKTTLVLLQELLGEAPLPVIVRGSLGPRGAAAAYAMGCAGCILDTQLLLVPEAGLGGDLREVLERASPSDTVLIGDLAQRPCRFLSAGAADEKLALIRREQEICRASHFGAEQRATFQQALAPAMQSGFAAGSGLLPVGQGIAFARQFAAQGMALRDVLQLYRSTIREAAAEARTAFAFREGSPFARRYGIRYPIVQGPMAGITSNTRLAEAVAEAGGLPFLAATGLTPEQTAALLAEGKRTLGDQPFGVGIIGFSQSEAAHVQAEIALANAPRCITFAGGDPASAKRLEDAGIDVYLHAPTQSHVRACLDAGVRGIILEGHEAGGHVGALGSLVLWELGVGELLSYQAERTAGTRVLFAGGIGNARGGLAAAVIAAPLAQREVLAGLQLGTAYLLTQEAVDRGAIPEAYQIGLLCSSETVVVGRTVNLPSRWLKTGSILRAAEMEFDLLADSTPLAERRKVLNLEEQRLAVGAMEAMPAVSAGYICGQGIALRDSANRAADLHEDLTAGAERLLAQVRAPEFEVEEAPEAVAIVGLGCIFPDASNPSEFWSNILNKVDSVREAPASYLDASLYYDPDRNALGKSYSKICAFIEGFRKDSLKFRIPPVSEPSIDPLQYLALEVAFQALVDAGYLQPDGAPPPRKLPRDRCAVVVGNSDGGDMRETLVLRGEWPKIARTVESVPEFRALPEATRAAILEQVERDIKRNIPEFTEDTCPGVLASVVAGRICNCFDLRGGAIAVDAACASSLAAIDTAVTALRDYRADVVLAGGVDTRLGAGTFILFSALGALSGTGSFPFDERADGFVLAQGAGMTVLKRLADAQRDGDRIYAVIRGVGNSSDGRVKGITAPDVNGQILALERAYRSLPFGPETLGFIEAHATGTRAGDIAEFTSMTRFIQRFSDRRGFIALGAVKSNIGHAKTAAGMAGLIKTALALHHAVLPPSIHCEQPRREADWTNTPLCLSLDQKTWPAGPHPRRAAVNSFGFGGLNYHAVLEEAPRPPEAARAAEANPDLPGHWLLFRAGSRGELIGQIERARATLGERRPNHSAGRATGPTLAVVAADQGRLASRLDKALKLLTTENRTEINLAEGIYYGERPLAEGEKVAFLFPGQGSQYPGMCGDLPRHFPVAGLLVGSVDTIARRSGTPSLLPLLVLPEAVTEERRAELEEALRRPDNNHPAMLAMSTALVELLARAGVRPDMAAGHSLGEYMALYAAGVYDLEQIVRITARRGRGITQQCFHKGIMGVVHMPAAEAEKYCARAPGFVAVANRNCPMQTVISGEQQAVEAVLREIGRDGIQAAALPVASAFHTRLLDPAVGPFRLFLNLFEPRLPAVPVQSNLTGQAHETGNGFAEQLRDTLVRHMVQPVEFIRNIESMYEAGARLFLEVGPGAVLCSFVDSILGERPHWSIPTNLPKRPASLQLMHALAFCAARGLPVNLEGLRPDRIVPLRLASRPRSPVAPVAVPAPSKPGLIEKALGGEDPALVREYFERFSGFLEQFALLDFQRYAAMRSPATPPPASEGKLPPTPADDDDLARKVVALVARKTGYPPEMIGMDLDVEAELGLDSIKQVEIVRAMTDELGVNVQTGSESRHYHISTLRRFVEELRTLMSGSLPAGRQDLPCQVLPEQAPAGPAYGTDCRRWVCELVEQAAADAPARDHLRGRHVLLLAADGGVASAMRRALSEAGSSVTWISPGTFGGEMPSRFDVVVDLLGFGSGDRADAVAVDTWWREVERRAEISLLASQRLAAGDAPPALWIAATSLGGDLGAASAPRDTGFAGVGLALSRCLAAESGGRVETLYLDFDSGYSDEDAARIVIEEAGRIGPDREIGYRGGKRTLLRWVSQEVPKGAEAVALGQDTVVLAVGGARGVTAKICLELAARGAGRFLVAGRSPEPEPSASRELDFETARSEVLAEIRAAGEHVVPAAVERRAWERVWDEERRRTLDLLRRTAVEVVYVQCDVSDGPSVERLARLLAERYGRVDLVVQGGGSLTGKLIADFTGPEFIRGMRDKALGAALMLRALEGIPVGAFINVSSVVGRWGNGGQSAYAAGHEVAAALVAGARSRPGRWLSLFYGPWLEVGMTRVGAVMERLQERGTQFLTPRAGGAALADEYAWGTGSSVALCGEEIARGWHLLAGLRRTPLLDHAQLVSPEQAEGRRMFDPRSDSFIADHVVSGVEPILPGMVALEMIAQTAGLLVPPRLEVTDVEDAEFQRAVRFPQGEPRELRSRARVIDRDENGIWLQGEAFSLFLPPGGGQPAEALHVRCRLRFGRRIPAPFPALVVPAAGLGNAETDLSSLYGTPDIPYRNGIFRTSPSFRSVTPDTVWAEVSVPNLPAFGDSPLLGNPLRLDGMFFVGRLAPCAFEWGSPYYLKAVRSIRFYDAADRRPEARRFCRSIVTQFLDGGRIGDLVALDAAGRVAESITGAHGVLAYRNSGRADSRWPSLREHPRQRDIRRLLGVEHPLALAQVLSPVVQAALEQDADTLIARFLSGGEREAFSRLSHTKRRREWLSGRVAAKTAARLCLDQPPGYPDISIETGEHGAPHLRISGRDGDQIHVSISHSGELSVALASPRPGFGIDVETRLESMEDLAPAFAEPAEEEHLAVGGLPDRRSVLAALWCLKEACFKARGGSRDAATRIRLESARRDGDYLVCALAAPDRARFLGVSFVEDGRAFAVAEVTKS